MNLSSKGSRGGVAIISVLPCEPAAESSVAGKGRMGFVLQAALDNVLWELKSSHGTESVLQVQSTLLFPYKPKQRFNCCSSEVQNKRM